MSQISSRTYQGPQDFQTMVDLMARVRPPGHRTDYPTRVDLEENLARAETRADTRLWFDEAWPVAWAYVDEFNNLRWEVETPCEEALGAEIVTWGQDCVRRSSGQGSSATLDASCREDDLKRRSFLERHGFSRTDDETIYMTRSLFEPVPGPTLPPGFIIRPIAGTQEAERVAATHRAAFGTQYMTTESRLAIMRTSEYDPSLDLVVVAPDGSIAANCICSVDEGEKKGSTDPVATHPHFQRMGLARALLLTGMLALKERGMRSAHLGTGGQNIAMQKAACSVGFVMDFKTIWFSKDVG